MNGLILAALLSLPPSPPPVSPLDVYRFPQDPVVEETRRRGREFRQALRSRVDVTPHRPELALALAESERADRAWEALDLARPAPVRWGSGPWEWSATHLTRLRHLIGPEAYARGEMPPIVPPWAFTPVD